MKQRDKSIDFMRSLLVVFMIMAHVVQFFYLGKFADLFSDYVDLTTFSGFMFAFGFVSYKAYISRNSTELFKRLSHRFLLTLFAFYLSGIAYTLLVANDFSFKSIIKILLLQKIPAYSEFLVSFAFLYPLIFLYTKIIHKTGKRINDSYYIILVIASLLLTRIDYSAITIPILGILIGTDSFACFPIIQYLSLFIAGQYLASRDKVFDKYILSGSFLGFAVFLGYIVIYDTLPQRFPPSTLWITGGYLFVYLHYIASKKLQKLYRKCDVFLMIGSNSLVFLVISNLVIFFLRKYAYNIYSAVPYMGKHLFCLAVFGLCILIPFLWVTVWGNVKTKIQR